MAHGGGDALALTFIVGGVSEKKAFLSLSRSGLGKSSTFEELSYF